MRFKNTAVGSGVLALAISVQPSLAASPPEANTPAAGAAAKSAAQAQLVDGKWTLPDGTPTYHIEGQTPDWYTYSGYRRYSSECHVCHGPDGEGSSYAPALVDSIKTLDYPTFLQTVAGGKQANDGGTLYVMPALGNNKNVMCYIDDIYVYLRARAFGGLGRGRPEAHADKPKEASQAETACLGP